MKGDRQRVCFVIPSLAGGGAERVAVQVLNALDRSRWDRSLFLFERVGPFLADLSPDITLESADVTSRIGQWRALRRFIRKARPDVVVAFLSYWSALTATRAAGVGAKVVFAIGTPVGAFLSDRDYRWSQPWNRRVFTIVMRTACALADGIIATSTGVADDLIESVGSTAARIRVVHNPVDVREVASAAREPIDSADEARWQRPVIVAAGRLAEAKNYALLIEAFAILRRRKVATLFILGTGDEEANLRSRIASLGSSTRCTCVDFAATPGATWRGRTCLLSRRGTKGSATYWLKRWRAVFRWWRLDRPEPWRSSLQARTDWWLISTSRLHSPVRSPA
jgi:glycosyltransferase involved in cell wall biosynthesis